MKKSKYFLGILFLFLFCHSLNAVIRLTDFQNNSSLSFKKKTKDGRSIGDENGIVIDETGAVIETKNGDYRIIFEDAALSGYHRPHWKFHIWIESKKGFPLIDGKRLLYAVVFYDGEGQISLTVDKNEKLILEKGYDCVDILYPWKVGVIGRGNPYHQIKNNGCDENGVIYFDYDNFFATPRNLVY